MHDQRYTSNQGGEVIQVRSNPRFQGERGTALLFLSGLAAERRDEFGAAVELVVDFRRRVLLDREQR